MSIHSHNNPMKRMIDKLADVIDLGVHEAHKYHLIHVVGGDLVIVERIENGRPIAYQDQVQTPDLIRNSSKDAATMHAMLVAEYARYGKTGLYPDFHANLWLVETVDIVGFTFHAGGPI